MMSPDDRALEDLLYGSDLGDEAEGAELGGGPAGVEESAAAGDTPTAVSIQEPMMCAGCGEQVCDRFFLLAAGSVWHSVCLRCSQCHCELQTHPSLYWRDGNIYCQQDYCRMFGGGQCARCFQPIPASALVMRSGELTFHPHCFSCQECDVKLIPGNLYCMQGQNLYCQSHYHDDGSASLSHDLQPQPNLKEAQTQVSGEGEESVSSPEPRLDGGVTGGRTRRRTKRIRTCFRSEQLRALESYFAQKHNPDGKDWTCLAHKTGLPKRVLQVWFQNARAKLRRSLTTDDSQVNSPSAPPRGATVATGSPPAACSPPDQSQPFSTSTIDQLQLSLLTAPLSDPPMRLSFHPGASQLALLSLALLCSIPRTVTSYPHFPTAFLPTVDGPELESGLLHLQAAQEDPRDDCLVQPDTWAEWPQDPRPALLEPGDEEGRSWEEEVLPRAQRGDLAAWPLSPFPGGHSLESMHYQEGGEGEDGGKRNEALTSIAGGLQAVSREKGGFGFRFGRKRWTDRGWKDEGRASTEENKWK
ncbi:LIM/homeobox protein Lhx9-like isoform X2 [Siniperca chuatsi]|uniref:LIM/homeobox protein Lhx9-like isoform X2 n=1 Tax=Siniperca chuatsi TaxID=119488 RepID=UPI001CE20753|nr:LIM/homeobox protein Lhx9-like isoform X2 [Siniperca chuatsi]